MQQEVAQGSVECSVARAEQKQGAAGGLAVEGPGVFGRGEAAAGAGEVGQGARDLGADRVDGADVEAVGVVGERPAELPVSGEDGAGEGPGLGLEVSGGIVSPIAVRLRWMEHPVSGSDSAAASWDRTAGSAVSVDWPVSLD